MWRPLLLWPISAVSRLRVPLGNGQRAALSTLIAGERPSVRLIAASAATGARIAGSLHVPSAGRRRSSGGNLHSVEDGAPVAALLF
jgi:hypothetical protein